MIKNAMTYLETYSTDPYYNLAFEEYILTHRMDGDYLILWQNENTVVIGQNQIAEAEVNTGFAKAHGIRIVRRATGGGAVYHDKGNLNYSFITHVGEVEEMTMNRFAQPIVEALRGLGLNADVSGRNDILVDGYKVSGTAQRIYKNRILFHGTLLFNVNEEMVESVLRVDPLKFQGKHTKSVRSRIMNIRSFLKIGMELTQFWSYLKDELSQYSGLEQGGITEEEEDGIIFLRNEKYETRKWNFRHVKPFDFSNKRKWDGGILEVRMAVEKEKITHVVFYGDFLSRMPLGELEQALIGENFVPQAVRNVFNRYELEYYFGGITMEEVLNTMFMT